MNKLSKTLLIVLVRLVMPIRHFGQTPYRQYADNGVVLDFFQIDNVYFRAYLLYQLNQDNQFILTQNEEWGQFSVNLNEESDITNFYDAFETFYNNASMNFGFLTKNDIDDRLPDWKNCIPPTQFLSMMMDIIMRNGRPVNNHCVDSDPFCTSDVISFEAATSSQTADQLEGTTLQDGCIGSSYNPSWYHMRIQTAGQFIIHMEGHDPNNSSTTRDIDFCIWGPYTDPTSPCVAQLTTDKIIDCCFSASYTEDIYLGYPEANHTHNTSHGTVYYHVPEVGEYYILMITNYSQQPCTITFTKTPNSGPGETDCGILPGVASNDGPYCVGETIHLSVNAQDGATYSWTGPGGFSSNQQNPTRPNCTMNMAGTYTCTTMVGSQSTTATTEVVIYPMPTANFNFTSVCVGNTTNFTSTSTTNPSGQQINSFQWNFGDGQIGTGQNVTHTYASAGTYQVTLTVSTGGHCTNQITKSVPVYALPSCNFTYTTVCQGTATQFTSTASSAPGNPVTNYQWNFGDGQTGTGQTVSHTYAQAGTYQVTHTVQTSGSCSDTRTQSVPVNATPNPTATVTPNSVIYGGVATLTANPGAQGTFNFHWEPANKVVNPNNQTTQTVELVETTTFTVTVTNPQGNCSGSTQVTVPMEGSNMTATATADQYEICEGESTILHANPIAGTGTYTFNWSPANTLSSPTIQNPVATPPVGVTTYTCQVSDGITNQTVSVSITVHPNVESDISVSICPDDTYNFFGNEVSQEGTYDHTIASHFGCDSTIHLHLSHYETYETPITRHYCQGDSYTFYGEELNSAGIYYHTLESAHGCDSIIRLNLVEDPSYTFYLTESTCQGGPGYYFDGQYLQPQSDLYTFTYQTVAGCDSIYYIQVDESEYNSKNYNVSICATQFTWASNGQTYYETGIYYDTLQYPNSCDSTLILNLELRPSYTNEVVATSCDTYRWKNDEYNVDMTFEQSTTYTHHYTNIYGCESEVTLVLTINDHDEYTTPLVEACDEYFWDPQGHEIIFTDHEDLVYNVSNTYHRTYKNQADCDSLVTSTMQFEYTPQPTEIRPADANNTAPHWVITATEFQINSYVFNIWEEGHPGTCHWDSITWAWENQNIQWLLEIDSTTNPVGKSCRIYVLNYVEDTVWLRTTVYNKCAPEGIQQRYWFVCSFYGVEEQEIESPAEFSVVPNPNNGTMTLNFENLTGKIDVRVYDMTGNLIDVLNLFNSGGPETMQYDMKHRAEGIYFFVATGKEGTVAKKVVIRR